MPYDYQLVSGALIVVIGFVGIANAMVEKRSPIAGLFGVLVGASLLGWGWFLSGQEMTVHDLPQAVYRLIAAWT